MLGGTTISFFSEKTKKFEYFHVHVNAYWITIKDTHGKVIFQRHGDSGAWMDKQHNQIVKAMNDFESVLEEAAGKEKEAMTVI